MGITLFSCFSFSMVIVMCSVSIVALLPLGRSATTLPGGGGGVGVLLVFLYPCVIALNMAGPKKTKTIITATITSIGGMCFYFCGCKGTNIWSPISILLGFTAGLRANILPVVVP